MTSANVFVEESHQNIQIYQSDIEEKDYNLQLLQAKEILEH